MKDFFPIISARLLTNKKKSVVTLVCPNQAICNAPKACLEIHPQMDLLFEAILNKDPNSHLIFLEGPSPRRGELLRYVLAKNCLTYRIRFDLCRAKVRPFCNWSAL